MSRVVFLLFMSCLALATSPLHAAPPSADNLEGLRGVVIMVREANKEAEADGLRQSDIQTAVELSFRKAGIKVFERSELSGPNWASTALLDISVTAYKQNNHYDYSYRVALAQYVQLVRDKSKSFLADTWSYGGFGTLLTVNLPTLQQEIQKTTDRCLNNFLAAQSAGEEKQKQQTAIKKFAEAPPSSKP